MLINMTSFNFLPYMTFFVPDHCRRKEVVSGGGGGGMTKKIFERHFFLGHKSHFPEKWGHMPPSPPSPVPTAL